MRRLVLLILIGSACSPDAAPEAATVPARDYPDPATWTVAPDPLLDIGVADGDEAYQFHMIAGAALLPDSSIAVLDAGSRQLRLYDRSGTLISRTGRQGAGPGEFRNPGRLYVEGDTLMIYDVGAGRYSLHNLAGEFLTVRDVRQSGRGGALEEWLHDGNWVEGPAFGVGRAAVRGALAQLPPLGEDELFRYVRVSPLGHLWVRSAGSSNGSHEWRIYAFDGTPLGRLALPARFQIHEFGEDYLLGSMRDEQEVEAVHMLRLDAPGGAPRAVALEPSPADTSRAFTSTRPQTRYTSDMQAALRMLGGQQEVHYSQHSTYASDVADLEGYEQPDDVRVAIVRANQYGWVALAVDPATRAVCAMASGAQTPAGWSPGRVLCDN